MYGNTNINARFGNINKAYKSYKYALYALESAKE
jgi:hypothetical protein